MSLISINPFIWVFWIILTITVICNAAAVGTIDGGFDIIGIFNVIPAAPSSGAAASVVSGILLTTFCSSICSTATTLAAAATSSPAKYIVVSMSFAKIVVQKGTC